MDFLDPDFTGTVREGNSLILRKGRCSLLASKVMLFALLKIEDRTGSKDTAYYEDLKQKVNVDYSKGLVSEIDVSQLKRLLKKGNSGSFYDGLQTLFSLDPYNENSLRNSWAVLMTNPESNVVGYTEIITACHYDKVHGKLFIKFSNEDIIRKSIWALHENFSELNVSHMLKFKKVGSYRLYEILYCEMTKMEEVSCQDQYDIEFQVGELMMMLGVVDLKGDIVGQEKLKAKNPDFNNIIDDINTRQNENMVSYTEFRRYILEPARKEINSMSSSEFTFTYSTVKGKRGGRVTDIVFHIQKKGQNDGFIIELGNSLPNLSFDTLKEIAEVSDYNRDAILSAYDLHEKLGISESFHTWFKNLKK